MRAPHEATRQVVKSAGTPAANALYKAFGEYNRAHFARRLAAPLVLITQTSARSLGDYCAQDEHGLQSRIRIAPRAISCGEAFYMDVLLHEMIHAWQEEVLHDGEHGYRGHGPHFARKANEIGARLGLAPVGVKGRDGLPDCRNWPMNVRPEGYYAQPFVAPANPNAKRGKSEGQGEEPTADDEGSDQASAPRAPRLPGRQNGQAPLGAMLDMLLGQDVARFEARDLELLISATEELGSRLRAELWTRREAAE